MKKTFLIINLIVILGCISTKSQTIKLKLDNPEPRIGQPFKIYFNLDFIENKLLKQLPSNFEIPKSKYNFPFIKPEFSSTIIAKDTGIFEIEPFEFTFNNIHYSSEKISIRIIDRLDNNIKEGIWIRILNENGKQIIILEQRILSKVKELKTNNTIEFIKEKDIDFATFDTNPTENIRFIRRYSYSLEENISKNSKELVNYSFQIYDIDILNNLKKDLIINRDFFNNLPDFIEIPQLIIKK